MELPAGKEWSRVASHHPPALLLNHLCWLFVPFAYRRAQRPARTGASGGPPPLPPSAAEAPSGTGDAGHDRPASVREGGPSDTPAGSSGRAGGRQRLNLKPRRAPTGPTADDRLAGLLSADGGSRGPSGPPRAARRPGGDVVDADRLAGLKGDDASAPRFGPGSRPGMGMGIGGRPGMGPGPAARRPAGEVMEASRFESLRGDDMGPRSRMGEGESRPGMGMGMGGGPAYPGIGGLAGSKAASSPAKEDAVLAAAAAGVAAGQANSKLVKGAEADAAAELLMQMGDSEARVRCLLVLCSLRSCLSSCLLACPVPCPKQPCSLSILSSVILYQALGIASGGFQVWGQIDQTLAWAQPLRRRSACQCRIS
jgi:hypothetical protein